MVTPEIALLSATELLALYRAGDVSPVEATRAALSRIEEHDPRVNAFCLVDAEGALSQARESEKRYGRGEPRGLLDGVPVVGPPVSAPVPTAAVVELAEGGHLTVGDAREALGRLGPSVRADAFRAALGELEEMERAKERKR